MPATAGRVRMPANNRVHSSAALQTHGIWQSAIGYDPYAPTNKDDNSRKSANAVAAAPAEPEGENAYASFQGLLQLAKITNSVSDEVRGACKKCGRVGHLTFQCRNFLSVKDEVKKDGKDDDLIREVVLEKLKGEKVKLNGNVKDKVDGGESSEEEEEESEISDSEYDSEIERIIANKYGKKSNGKRKLSSGKKDDDDEEEDEDEEDEDEGKKRRKRGRSKKRSSRKMESSDSEDADEGGRGRKRKNKRKEKRCRRDDYSTSSDDGEDRRRKRKTRQEKRRRRSHRHSSEDSSEESPERGHTNKRRSRRLSSPSDSDVSVSDDSRIGRYKKRVEKNSRKRHREREN